MLNRRKSDRPDQGTSTLGTSPFALSLKRLIILLLRNFKTFSTTSATRRLTPEAYETIDAYIAKLRSIDSIENLEEIRARLKQLLDVRQEAEQLQRAQRLSHVESLLANVSEGLSEIETWSEEFTDQVKTEFQKMASLGSQGGSQLQEEFERCFDTIRQLVQTKQERDQRATKYLQQRIERLEKQLVEANEELVMDALTRVYNRQAFDTHFEECFKRHLAYGESFALLLCDIDHFKDVNDQHGHLIGDRVLRAVAQTAKQTFRIDDFVARYGGDEFAVVLHDTSGLYAYKAAERFRLAVARKVLHYQQDRQIHTLHLTLSIGLASYRPGDTPETLFQRADQALYLAKSSRRNQVRADVGL